MTWRQDRYHFLKMSDDEVKCDICNGLSLPLFGCGVMYDNLVCTTECCPTTKVVFDTSTGVDGKEAKP